jgi:alpha-L-fucosidase
VRARAAFAACALLATCAAPGERVDWPGPVAPVPSARQLAWQELEYYAFVHFNMNTFTEREWGLGKESPAQFAPSALDCRQWARVAKLAGMKGIILTAKHHDGFCLWPSKLTDHTVASSNWRDGRGDVLRELSDACHEYGLKFGVYLSPWDRHSPLYGQSDAYNDFFAGQLEEVLTQYGEVFEVWFDGACGEGPNGKLQVYNWERFVSVVRRCQPNAVIFSDVGPDVRWVGNENGFAGATCWSMLSPGGHTPGANAPPVRELNEGSQDGSHWIAAECDVSIRPGWYYRASEDDKVKTVKQLLEVYCASVGRNGSLLLNLPVDRRGLVHENDAARLLELRKTLDALFANDLARAGRASASNVRSGDEHFAAARATDGDARTYWATDDGVTTASSRSSSTARCSPRRSRWGSGCRASPCMPEAPESAGASSRTPRRSGTSASCGSSRCRRARCVWRFSPRARARRSRASSCTARRPTARRPTARRRPRARGERRRPQPGARTRIARV